MDLMEQLYSPKNRPGLRPSTLIAPPCISETYYYPESLSSFIIRLSNAHHINVGELVRKFLQPRISSRQKRHILHRCNDGYSVNGAGCIGRELFQVVKSLISQTDKTLFANFYFLESLIGKTYKNLISKEQFWCPLCLEEASTAYYPLYWHSLSVKCCIKHRIKLRSTCPACNSHSNVISASTRIGVCASCNHSLIINITQSNLPLEVVNSKDIWIAENINSLAKHHQQLAQLDLLRGFRGNLKLICREYGSVRNAERRLGFSETLFQRWLTRNRPNFTEFVELGYRLQIPLIKLLTPSDDIDKITTCYFYRRLSLEDKPPTSPYKIAHNRLVEIIDDQEVISIKALAKELGKSEGFLQYHFRDLLNEIIQIRSSHVNQAYKEQQEKLIYDAAVSAIQLMMQGKYFGGRNMTKSLSERIGHKKLSNKLILKFIHGDIRNLSDLLPIDLRDKLSPKENKES